MTDIFRLPMSCAFVRFTQQRIAKRSFNLIAMVERRTPIRGAVIEISLKEKIIIFLKVQIEHL